MNDVTFWDDPCTTVERLRLAYSSISAGKLVQVRTVNGWTNYGPGDGDLLLAEINRYADACSQQKAFAYVGSTTDPLMADTLWSDIMPRCILAGVDQNLTDTTPADDTHLVTGLAADTYYELRAVARWSQIAGGGGLAIGFAISGTGAEIGFGLFDEAVEHASGDMINIGGQVGNNLSPIFGWAKTGAGTGTILIRRALAESSASATVLKATSMLITIPMVLV